MTDADRVELALRITAQHTSEYQIKRALLDVAAHIYIITATASHEVSQDYKLAELRKRP